MESDSKCKIVWGVREMQVFSCKVINVQIKKCNLNIKEKKNLTAKQVREQQL